MAFLMQEKMFGISCENFFNSDLLMSFLEESPSEECNHEELDRLMRSLKAEIYPSTMDIQDLTMEPESLTDGEESHGFESVDDLDFHLGDLEPMTFPTPSNDMNYWHVETLGEEVDTLIEIEDDFSDTCIDDVLEGQMYTTSWIETDALELYS